MSGIANKVVAITGASGGIGAETARLLAKRGAKVVLGARRTERLDAVAAEIVDAGGAAAVIACDVTRRADLAALVALAQERFGRLDVFVGNAGIAPNSPLDELRVDDWEAMIDVNVKGMLFGIAAALPVFRAQASGHFVTVLSTAGLVILPTMAIYAAAKQAMRAISEGLRLEAGPRLRVTNVSPGFIRTDFAESINDPAVKAAIIKKRDAIAIGPDAIARAITFAIEQPGDVDINEIVVRPTAQA